MIYTVIKHETENKYINVCVIFVNSKMPVSVPVKIVKFSLASIKRALPELILRQLNIRKNIDKVLNMLRNI